MKNLLVTIIGLCGWLTCAMGAKPPWTGIELEVFPTEIEQGGAALLRLSMADAQLPSDPVEVFLETQKLPTWECTSQGQNYICALASVSLEQKTGTLSVSAKRSNDQMHELVATGLTVRERKARESQLKVAPRLTKLSEAELKRVEAEKKDLDVIFSSSHPLPLWQGAFRLPGKGSVTSRFGNRRSFNHEVKSIHYGVDLRAPTGTPILSSNDGKVVAAKNFFYGGNMVIVDHGTGLFTGYAHLSAFAVRVGDTVQKGKRLGLSGATGRVTGPHLHWTCRINGESVDPLAAINALRWALPVAQNE